MKNKINGGIYQIDLNGTNNAEFKGNHPSIVIESIKNNEMFYIIPLTSFTEERWEKYRKNYCCKISSSKSIARIDKLQLRHINEFSKRWLTAEKELLIISPEEVIDVFEHIEKYMHLSLDKSQREYEKYYSNFNYFKTLFYDTFFNYRFQNKNFNINITSEEIELSCDKKNVSNISLEDIKRIIWQYIPCEQAKVKYHNNKIYITILLTNKNGLTFKNEYDKFNLTERYS